MTAPAITAIAQPADVDRPSPGNPYARHIADAAQRFHLPPAWIRAVMRAESDSEIAAISRKGARGLMQIMPATWLDLRVRHRLGPDPYDPRDNILAGAAYLRELYDRYGSPGFLAAYNAGPARYEAYLAGRPLPAETRAYVAMLAPIIGVDKRLRPFVLAAVDPRAWKRAPLFVAQLDRQSAAVSLPVDRRSNDRVVALEARSIAAIVPRSASLFAERAGGGRAP
ncbi:lytic transglycosylase domain-containing protein [Labrys neptuniae]|uniref:lytic transglycosylase domain-containing protein n=1 Tax=Labrys neptuniae TaxID=376174 RepID=UPI00288EF8CF|nr:lytic transglycosylase domain-containing protein [Labrys neptuniae]MDT3382421.1 lytic transglycosylase domain-containing protein [Labrys neptuniae]